MLSKLLLVTIIFAVTPTIARAKQACADEDLFKESLTIGTFPTLLCVTTTATADYYFCAKSGMVPNKATLVIIIPGDDAGKAAYSMAAKAFVDRGYTELLLKSSLHSVTRRFTWPVLGLSRSLSIP